MKGANTLESKSELWINLADLFDLVTSRKLACPFVDECGPDCNAAIESDYEREFRLRIPTCLTPLYHFSPCYNEKKKKSKS